MTRTDYTMAGRLGAKYRALPIKINKKVRGGGPKIGCEKVAVSPPSHKIIVKV